jgi:hypothetical protein
MKNIGTKYCFKCGKPSVMFSGHLKAKQKMALGNLIETKITVGWCSEECHDSMSSDINGCYGTYDNTTMEVIQYF